jgi:low affinity Fe/Cu permease
LGAKIVVQTRPGNQVFHHLNTDLRAAKNLVSQELSRIESMVVVQISMVVVQISMVVLQISMVVVQISMVVFSEEGQMVVFSEKGANNGIER